MKTLYALLIMAAGLGAYAQPLKLFDLGLPYASNLVVINGKLFFNSGASFWISDGTTAGTTMLANRGHFPVEMGGSIYFGKTGMYGWHELWVTDGTVTGTTMVKVLDSFYNNSVIAWQYPLTLNGKIYFVAHSTIMGEELWVTDGTAAGTNVVADLAPGSASSNPQDLFIYNHKVYFKADDGSGNELWVTDGTAAGTLMVKDINQTAGLGSSPNRFTIYNNSVYFFADDGINGQELWVSDGTFAGTQMVKDIYPGAMGMLSAASENIMVYNNKLFFVAKHPTTGNELWTSDGTAAGTVLLKDINPGINSGSPYLFTIYKNNLYFFADNGMAGNELWKTDGTSGGTAMVMDFNPGIAWLSPGRMFVYRDWLCFTAAKVSTESRLWVSDGTLAGTILMEPSNATRKDPVLKSREFVIYDSAVYFAAAFNNPERLWVLKDSSLTTNVNETKKAITFSLLPNPAHDNFTIKINVHFNHGTVQLTDMNGKVIQVQELKTGTQNIPLKGIAPGIYTVTVLLDDKRSTQRLVVE